MLSIDRRLLRCHPENLRPSNVWLELTIIAVLEFQHVTKAPLLNVYLRSLYAGLKFAIMQECGLFQRLSE